MSNEVRIAIGDIPNGDELRDLYASVGWMVYADNPALLQRAVKGSSFVVTARRDGVLIGFARAISDDATICYLQDILVTPPAQRLGLGRRLANEVLLRYAGVRQKVLLTDDEPGQRAFYESLGFTEVSEIAEGPLRSFVRFDS